MAKVRLEFDESLFDLGTARHVILRAMHWRYEHGRGFAKELAKKQKGRCALCGGRLKPLFQVDHIKSVKAYAYDLSIPLDKAAKLCYAKRNLRAVHPKCNWARNRRRRGPA